MSLVILRTQDADLTRVQQNVAKELAALEEALPSAKNPSTPITADYAVKLTDVLVLANPASDINVTLPAFSTWVGQELKVKNISNAATVHMRGQFVNGAFQLIDGFAPYDVPSGTCVTVYSDGFRGWIV